MVERNITRKVPYDIVHRAEAAKILFMSTRQFSALRQACIIPPPDGYIPSTHRSNRGKPIAYWKRQTIEDYKIMRERVKNWKAYLAGELDDATPAQVGLGETLARLLSNQTTDDESSSF